MSQPIVSINNLQDYYFSGNIPRIRVLTTDPIEVTIELVCTNGLTITELHEPRLHEDIVLDINALIHKHLSARWATSPLSQSTFDLLKFMIQPDNFGTVIITPAGQSPGSFKVIKGIVDAPHAFDFKQYARDNLLNLCPQVKTVGYDDPDTINYYALSSSVIKLQAKVHIGFNEQGSPQYSTIDQDYIALSDTDTLFTIKTNFNTLADSFTLDPSHEIIHIDIWATNNSPSGKTTPIRLIADKTKYKHYDVFAFENSLGGIEIIRFTGVLSKIIDHDYLSLVNQNQIIEYETIPHIKYEKNTGFLLTAEHIAFANDFLASTNRYHYKNGVFERIYLTGKDAKYQKGNLSYYSFTFSYANEIYGTLLNRKTIL